MSSAWTVRGAQLSRFARMQLVVALLALFSALCAAEVAAAPPFATNGSAGTGSYVGSKGGTTHRTYGSAGTDYARRWDARRYYGFPQYTQSLRRSQR